MLKKLFSHSLIYGLAPQITKLASIFAMPLITKELTKEDYGISAVINSYTAALGVLSILGLRVILVNSFYKSPNQFKIVWRQIFGFLNLWNIIYALLVALVIVLVIPEEAKENLWTIILLNAAPLILLGKTAIMGNTYYQLNQRPLPIVIRTVIFGFLTIALNYYTIAHLKMGYMGWFWTAGIVGLLSNASYFYPVYYKLKLRPIYNFRIRYLIPRLKISLPLIPHYYSIYLLNTSDKVVMNVLEVTTPDLGKYSAADTLGNLMKQYSEATGSAVGPIITKLYKDKDFGGARTLIFVLMICTLTISFLLSLWSKELFAFLIRNDELAQMYYLGIWLIMAQAYRPMYLGFSSKYMYFEKTMSMLKVSFMAGFLNVILNLCLIPFFGFEVGAITTFICYMYMGYIGFSFKGFKALNKLNYYPLLWLMGTILLTLSCIYLVELSFAYKMLISIILFVVLLLVVYKNRKYVK